MLNRSRPFLSGCIQPIARAFKAVLARSGYRGNYASWADAQQASTGYNSELILERVKNALLKVKSGEAVYERDSVLFDEIQYSWPLLTGLLWVATCNNNRLNLIDFGGSLGSTYFQNRYFLKQLDKVSWNIVEQQIFVDCGKKYFEDDCIKFYANIDECASNTSPNAIILSSVLPYLENPYEMLNKLMEMDIDFVFIDLTPFSDTNQDMITVHRVSPEIYKASIPTWILSHDKFVKYMGNKYHLVSEYEIFKPIYFNRRFIRYMGFLYESKSRNKK